jgi:superoxide oxidase
MSALTHQRYVASARRLHWAIFGLVTLAYLFINLFGAFARGSAGRTAMLHWHELAGLGVLLLALPRLWVRAHHTPPLITPRGERWADTLATVTHIALYAFLLVQPLLGLITVQVEGASVSVFGVTLLPSFVATPDRALAHQFEDIHGTIGTIFYWVIGLHILAVLWHHFIRRDDTLRRML